MEKEGRRVSFLVNKSKFQTNGLHERHAPGELFQASRKIPFLVRAQIWFARARLESFRDWMADLDRSLFYLPTH
jgi:hypothetical protein